MWDDVERHEVRVTTPIRKWRRGLEWKPGEKPRLSQQKLADLMGVDRTTVVHWERYPRAYWEGKRVLVNQIAAKCGLPPDDPDLNVFQMSAGNAPNLPVPESARELNLFALLEMARRVHSLFHHPPPIPIAFQDETRAADYLWTAYCEWKRARGEDTDEEIGEQNRMLKEFLRRLSSAE